MPGYYPDNYYNTNALHFAPFVSFNLNFNNENVNILKNKTIYFDIGTLDTYIWYYLKTKAMNFTEILNLAIGVNFPLFIKEKAKQ